MINNVLIVVQLGLIVALLIALVRVENERYAMSIGMCPGLVLPDSVCLSKVQTRTGWWWHVYYSLVK